MFQRMRRNLDSPHAWVNYNDLAIASLHVRASRKCNSYQKTFYPHLSPTASFYDWGSLIHRQEVKRTMDMYGYVISWGQNASMGNIPSTMPVTTSLQLGVKAPGPLGRLANQRSAMALRWIPWLCAVCILQPVLCSNSARKVGDQIDPLGT